MDSSKVESSIVIIPDQLLFVSVRDPNFICPASTSSHIYLCTDESLIYTAFFADFGPLNLGLVYTFCKQVKDAIASAQQTNRIVVYCCSSHPHRRANAAVLVCAYMIFVLNYSAERAYAPFIACEPPLYTFRDAGFCINTFPITVLDCARGMRKAVAKGHFNFDTFDLNTFQRLAKLQNGDISWIVPGKFIAFSGPVAKKRQISEGVWTLSPQEYVPLFKSLGVTCVVRFNSKCYDRAVFTTNGIRHVDLYYEDGGNPTDAILQAFLQLCEHEKGAIAVHCKAGLGRTGTNIAAYMIKHYMYTAREAIAWHRICRPGSIVGPQQQYLCSKEESLRKEGVSFRLRNNIRDAPDIAAERTTSASTSASAAASASSSTRRASGSSSSGVAGATRGTGAMTPPLFNSAGNGSHNGAVSGANGQSNMFKPLFKRDGSNGSGSGAAASGVTGPGSGPGSGSGSGSATGNISNSLNRSGSGGNGMVVTNGQSAVAKVDSYTSGNFTASYTDSTKRPNTSGGLLQSSSRGDSRTNPQQQSLQQSVDYATTGLSHLRVQQQQQQQQLGTGQSVVHNNLPARPQSGSKRLITMSSEDKKNRKFAFGDGTASVTSNGSIKGNGKSATGESTEGVRASYDGTSRSAALYNEPAARPHTSDVANGRSNKLSLGISGNSNGMGGYGATTTASGLAESANSNNSSGIASNGTSSGLHGHRNSNSNKYGATLSGIRDSKELALTNTSPPRLPSSASRSSPLGSKFGIASAAVGSGGTGAAASGNTGAGTTTAAAATSNVHSYYADYGVGAPVLNTANTSASSSLGRSTSANKAFSRPNSSSLLTRRR